MRGFSLIEVLIAVAIIGAGLVALVRLQTHLVSNAALAKQRSEAAMLGQQKIDDLRRFATMAAYDALGSGSDQIAGTTATFARTWTLTKTSTAPLMADLRVSVAWVTSQGETQTAALDTAIAANDPKLTAQLIVSGSPGGAATPTSNPVTTSTTISTSSTPSTPTSPPTTTTTTTTTNTTPAPDAIKRTIALSSLNSTCTSADSRCTVPKKSKELIAFAISPAGGLTAADIAVSVGGPQASQDGPVSFSTDTSSGSFEVRAPSDGNQAFTVTITVPGASPVVLYYTT